MTRQNLPRNLLGWTLAAILAAACVLLYWRPWEPAQATTPETETPRAAANECDPQIDARIAEVMQLHQAGKWSEAVDAWDELVNRVDLCPRQRDEVERHRLNARDMAGASQSVSEYVPARPPAPPQRPAPKEDFLAYYPAGKSIRSTAFLHIDGEGENKFWVFVGRAFFAYQYHVNAEKTVRENDGEQAVFEVAFREVNQIRAVSQEELELRGWDDASPLLMLVWEQLDENFLSRSPEYFVLKKVGQFVNVVDPRLKRSLTAFNEFARFAGFPLLDRVDVQIAAQIERLSGTKLEVVYVRELGVTSMRVLEGEKIPRDELAELAYNSSLLMDYFIFPQAREKQPGDEWEVGARDVAGVLNLNFDVEVSGSLRLRRGGELEQDERSLTELQLVGGEVEASVQTPDGPQATTITPESGLVLYSQDDLMIHSAQLQWRMTEIQASRDHLLFGTENVTNLRVQSRYAATRP